MSGRALIGRVAVVGLAVVGAVLASIDLFTLFFYGAYMAVGAFLVVRRPRNIVGWLLIVIAFGFIATTTPPDVDVAAIRHGEGTARDTLIIWIEGWAGLASYVGFVALTIFFPSGHIPDQGRGTSMILLVVGVAVVVVTAVAPTIGVFIDASTSVPVANPFPVVPDLPIWSIVPLDAAIWPTVFALLIIGVARMVRRFRRATGIERLQLRWLVSAVVFVLIGVAVGFGWIIVFGDLFPGFGWIVALVAYPTVPLAVGFAVMRYRLLEIDRIISRTIGWVLVTGVLVAIFAGGVLTLQAVLERFTQGQTFAVAVSTLVAFALFQPLRRRIQSVVDRRFDRARYDGERTTAAFAGRLRDQIDLIELEADYVATVGKALRPTSTSLWLKQPSRHSTHTTTP